MHSSLHDLDQLITRRTSAVDYPQASRIEKNIPLYDCQQLNHAICDLEAGKRLRRELNKILLQGPGVYVLCGAFADTTIVDAATDVFRTIIAEEKSDEQRGGDHFAEAGANDRLWNSLQKLCLRSPAIFAKYHGNPWLQLASLAWLGPGFQMTAQVNLVRPGGKAQSAHCDYHLGFMTDQQTDRYPPHVHAMSSRLTLQGAVAHCDMPVETGPTKLLPFSHDWTDNYRGFREAPVQQKFDRHCVQMELSKGDALFFSPALLHAAGENRTTNIDRWANLLQVSSPLGRAMETIDRTAMCKALYPELIETKRCGRMRDQEIDAAIASCAEGYPFPTNLDSDPPLNGKAPISQQELFHQAMKENWTTAHFCDALDQRDCKRGLRSGEVLQREQD